MPTPTPGGQLADLKTMFDDPLFAMVAHLGTAPNYGSLDALALSDITEANFPGYAALPINPTIEQAVDEVGYADMDAFPVEWVAGAIVTPQTITCIYVTKAYNNDHRTLASIVFFPHPIQITAAGQIIEQEIHVEGIAYAT